MLLTAHPFFFIIKINKAEQIQNRKFDGTLAVSPNYTFMQHELQAGEIVSIGKMAAKLFPQAKVADTLIFHHFVTGKGLEDKQDSPFLVYTDDTYRYYNVTISSYNGERNMTYGYFDGQQIIPHKDYIFLETEEIKKTIIEKNGLFEVDNFLETRDSKGDKMKEIKNQIIELTKSDANDELKKEIEKKERQMNKISKDINKKHYQIYPVAFSPLHIQKKVSGKIIKAGVLNIACNTKLFFHGKEYIIAPSKYITFVA